MKFDWSKQDMKRCLDEVMAKEKITYYDKYIINFYCDYLNLHNENKEQFNDKIEVLTNKEITIALEEVAEEFKHILSSLPKKVCESLYTQVECLKKFCRDEKEYYLPNNHISNQDLFDQSYKIFGSISPYFTKCLDYIYHNNLIKVERNSFSWNQDNCCNVDFHHNLGYVYFNSDNDFMSFESILNHELSHSIITIINKKILNYYINEFSSIYMNLFTDLKLYNDSKNVFYLKSYSNYMNYLKSEIKTLSFLFALLKCKNFKRSEIEDTFFKTLSYDIANFNSFFNVFLSNMNINDLISYLFSGNCALHLLEQDPEKARRMFIDFNFTEFTNMKHFFKMIDLNFKDPYYMGLLFNKKDIEIREMIRKK